MNEYRCKCGSKDHHFKAGHPPKWCPRCGETLALVPGLTNVMDDSITAGEQRSAFLQLSAPGDPPPETRSQLRALERKNVVQGKAVGSKREI